jgi:glycosyltransferase involved in cell wall biosynthesis
MGLRVLLLAPHPFFSERGTPIAVAATLEVLAGAGHRVDVLTYHAGSDVDIPGVTVHRIWRPPLVRDIPIGPSWQKFICDSVMAIQASRMARAGKYDLVHAVEEASFFAWWIRRRTSVPYVYDMDSVLSQQLVEKGGLYKLFAPGFRMMERAAIRHADGLLAVCPAVAEVSKGVPTRGRTLVLPDFPLRIEDPWPAPSELLDAPAPRLVYVGNLESYQGIDLMMDAFRRIAADTSATLVIIGGTREAVAEHRARAGALERSGRIRFLGAKDLRHLNAICGAADVLLSPRRLGLNTPMKIFNYMDSGTPILATRLPTHTQVLDDSTALLVDPDPRSMADGMVRLLGSAELRERLGSGARRLVRSQYDRGAFRRRLVEFYRELEAALVPSTTDTGAAHAGSPAHQGTGRPESAKGAP